MMPEAEKIESPSSFEKLTEQFNKMEPFEKRDQTYRIKWLDDRTLVRMTRFRAFSNDPKGSLLLNEYQITVSPPASCSSSLEDIKSQPIRFVITEKNTLKSVSMPMAEFTINDAKVKLMFKVQDKERYVAQKDNPASVSAASSLTDWFCGVMTEGKYTKPQVSISN